MSSPNITDAVTAAALELTTAVSQQANTTHLFDTFEDLIIHPHWKQFPPVSAAWHNVIGIFITFVGITGVIGNLVVIYTFSKTKGLRTASNMFVVNLALSDLTFSAVNGFPLFSISAFSHRWIFGQVACELYGLTGGIFGLMSINTMAAISVDRYFVITRPFTAMRTMTHKRAFLMIVVIWIWSILWAIPPIFGWGAYILEGFQTSCTFDYLTRSDTNRSFIMCMYLCSFVLPLAIIIFCYVFIIRSVMNHEKEMAKLTEKLDAKDARNTKDKQKAEIKIAKVSMTIIVLYLLSWTPYALVALIAQWGPAHVVNPFVSEIPVLFAKASAMHDPIVYALSHPKFRDAVAKLLPWFLCCCGLTDEEKKKQDELANKSRLSRVTSQTSAAYSEGSSIMSNLSDTYPNENGIEMNPNPRGSRRNRNVQETDLGTGEINGRLIRDILQAFVGVVQTRNGPNNPSSQMPMYVPYPYGIPPEMATQDGQPRQDIHTISQPGGVPLGIDPRILAQHVQQGAVPGLNIPRDQMYIPKDTELPPPPAEEGNSTTDATREPPRAPSPNPSLLDGEPAVVEVTGGNDNKAFEENT